MISIGKCLLVAGALAVVAPEVPCLAGSDEATQISSTTLSLQAAVTKARTASPQRAAAALVAEGAQAAARTAGPLANPVFELRTENWAPGMQGPHPDVDVFAVLMQPIEIGGKRGIRRELAASESAVALATLKTVERELAIQTVRAYVRGLKARALVDILTRNREGLTTLVESVGHRVREGYSAEADLLKFKTEAARVDGDIARAHLDLERSLAALAVVIGATEPILSSQLVEPPPIDVPAVDSQAIAAKLTLHPEVLVATANLEHARQLSAFERARVKPDPLLAGGYKRTAGFDTMVLGVSVAVPLFDQNRSSVTRALSVERAAEARREAIVHQLTTDAGSVVRAAHTISEQAGRAPKELLAPAEQVRQSALAAFREGAADVLKLIDAERVYAEVHRAAIDLRLDALLMTIEARFALGEETIP